ncbi:hypothetical protein [Nocardioides jishulii]|uniref:Uncharacterized protein n=1 Tax=Nocardioides jishulii TaxID=2575440 RepID=A0A4U2YPE0_9ACTN|nr:hypothetical protein [Nocardioides jishulii]QCX27695.1 hypothetical protein FCL41_09285 [Nocardioides jishulii]TKI62502.1 hypothetical protein FC770_08950 [Nocardioides jishulii]
MESELLEREWRLLLKADPAARAALAATNPHAAYEAISWSRNDLLDDPQMPHVGAIFCAWAELEDLYEIGRTSPNEFQAIVRIAMDRWLSRPAVQSRAWIERWVTDTRGVVAARFKEDGTILDGKPV